jgi:predicted transcriptional regulator YdeE
MYKTIITIVVLSLIVVLTAVESQPTNEETLSAEIIKVYQQEIPATRFIGKRYTKSDMIDGMFSHVWEEWGNNGWFDIVEGMSSADLFIDSDGMIGMFKMYENEFEYWLGMFFPADTKVPDGFQSIDFSEHKIAVCWVKGVMPDIFFLGNECIAKIKESGYEHQAYEDNGNTIWWYYERYATGRSENPADDGTIILDMCFIVE